MLHKKLPKNIKALQKATFGEVTQLKDGCCLPIIRDKLIHCAQGMKLTES